MPGTRWKRPRASPTTLDARRRTRRARPKASSGGSAPPPRSSRPACAGTWVRSSITANATARASASRPASWRAPSTRSSPSASASASRCAGPSAARTLALQTRTRVLNGELEDTFRRRWPVFRPSRNLPPSSGDVASVPDVARRRREFTETGSTKPDRSPFCGVTPATPMTSRRNTEDFQLPSSGGREGREFVAAERDHEPASVGWAGVEAGTSWVWTCNAPKKRETML